MAKLTIVRPPEPELTLELTLNEAAGLYTLLGETAGNAKEMHKLYDVLYAEDIVVEQAAKHIALTSRTK